MRENLPRAIVARNYRTRMGEIDLVAQEGGTLVFVEVRLRKTVRSCGLMNSRTPISPFTLTATVTGQVLSGSPTGTGSTSTSTASSGTSTS